MRYFEDFDGRVKNEDQIREILSIMKGSQYSGRDIDSDIKQYLPGIKREITDFNEWRNFAKRTRVGAMQLYRELTGCRLLEAKNMIDKYIEEVELHAEER